MVEMRTLCDFCNQPMPVVDIEGFDTVELFRTKEIDTKKLFPHLCKNCADKLDKTMLLCKKRWLEEGDAVAAIAKRNAERRELLRTKG